MRRFFAVWVGVLAVAVLSCTDVARPPTGPLPASPLDITVPASCPAKTTADFEPLVAAAVTSSPAPSSIMGQLSNVLSANTLADAQSRVLSLIDFIFKQYRDHPNLRSTVDPAAMKTLLNALSCATSLNVQFDDMDDAWLIPPSNQPTELKTKDGGAGLKIPGNAVDEWTLIAIIPVGWTDQTPGSGPLNTLLDQYKGFYKFTKSNPNQFNSHVIMSICAVGASFDIAEYLRIGKHAPGEGDFELLLKPEEIEGSETPVDLNCGDSGSDFLEASAADVVAFSGHGVSVNGGTRQFTTAAPVNTQVSTSGDRVRFSPIEASVLLDGSSCATSYPAGSDVPFGCRPGMILQTPEGTLLSGVHIDWSVIAGGGVIARGFTNPPGCELDFTSAGTYQTNAAGQSVACWRLGTTPGTNTVKAVAIPNTGDANSPHVVFGEFINGEFVQKSEWEMSLQGTTQTPEYDFQGFFSPIRMDVINGVKAGNAVPIKFTLGGNFGLNIFAPANAETGEEAYPQIVLKSCPNGVAVHTTTETIVTSGGSTLSYNSSTGQYNYSWKTDKKWAGLCGELRVRFFHDQLGVPEAGYYSAEFRFNK